MSENFNFEEWFNSLKVSEDIHDTYKRTMLDLVANNIDVSRYIISHNIMLNNIEIIEKDKDDKYFVDITIPRVSDITTDFIAYPYYESENSSSEVNLKIILNGLLLNINSGTKIVNSSAMFNQIKIRLTFTGHPFLLRFNYLSYILNSDLRENLNEKNFIQDGISYNNLVARIV